KVLAIAQKYDVKDEHGQPRFYVVRPPHLALTLGLSLVMLPIRIALIVFLFRAITSGGAFLVPFLIFLLASYMLSIARVLLAPLRHIEIFTDESQAIRLLTITQDNKLGLFRIYTL